MSLNFSGLSGYEKSMNTASLEGTPSLGRTYQGSASSPLAGASAGQVVTGEITNISGKQIQLKLPEGQTVNARLEADMKVSVGQSLAFEVKSNSGSQISLTPLFQNTAVNPAAIKALNQASILVTEASLSMTSTMMDQGMSVDRNSLQQMYRLVNQYPGADAADLVSMKAQGLPISEESLTQYAAYKENQHQIISLAGDLADKLSGMLEELPVSGRLAAADLFTDPLSSDTLQELTDGLQGEAQDLADARAEQLRQAAEAAAAQANRTPPSILDIAAGIAQSREAAAAESEPPEAAVVETPEAENAPAQEQDTQLNALLTREERDEIADTLMKFGLSEDAAREIREGTADPERVMNLIRGAGRLAQDGTLEAMKLPEAEERNAALSQLTGSSGFSKLLKDSLVSSWSIEPDGETSKDKITKLYERIVRDTERTGEFLEQFGKGESDLAKGVENLRQNLNFMNQLNEMFNYVQLPIKMSGENAHGDLYVYSKKKNMSLKDGEVTALLHLEMETLGTMDIHVAMKDEDHVNTHFYLQDDEMLDFINDHIDQLDARLEKRGYKVSTQVSLKEDAGKDAPENPVITQMLGSSPRGLMTHYSFDAKA